MIDDIRKKAESYLTTKRLVHTLSVEETAVKIASFYSVDENKVRIASILHDIAKDIPIEKSLEIAKEYNIDISDIFIKNPDLIHAFLGAIIAKNDFGIDDQEIIESIKYHTLGKENMGLISLIVYISDFVEPNKKVSNKIKEIIVKEAMSGYIYRAAFMVCVEKIKYVISEMKYMHPDTLFFYNFLCENERKCLLPNS
ncbi:MAG TPA: bis(5'-nucleosyl)-tetraphosphatase (symmetrical) YqeK [Spirochaetota bacterium]|nr:bis(5'-nucleosyl)-tetraphosphatase (symmetrical) YqeK [Spirochaetota bacterium]HOM37634.1 bis(5'-nucleosyl)-tetraphosphatase (symmetrical) YqeK [Spirochaetota bacterium]HPQ49395.1 bis(5'-nucleosyl)-tetraphosphatase (symmetrical) YqeK [Spirochaetota bacterium]